MAPSHHSRCERRDGDFPWEDPAFGSAEALPPPHKCGNSHSAAEGVPRARASSHEGAGALVMIAAPHQAHEVGQCTDARPQKGAILLALPHCVAGEA